MKYVIFDCDGTLIDTSGPQIQLYPGIKELLAQLSPTSLLYVWTARDRSSTIRILKELGIFSYFDEFSTFDDCLPKPSSDGLMRLVGKIPKSSICVIGDSLNDMVGAKSFGVMAIGALWNKASLQEFLEEGGADFIVSHPSECSRLIELNLKGDSHV